MFYNKFIKRTADIDTIHNEVVNEVLTILGLLHEIIMTIIEFNNEDSLNNLYNISKKYVVEKKNKENVCNKIENRQVSPYSL